MRHLIAVAALVALVGCKSNTERYHEMVDALLAKYRPRLTERLDQLRAVQAAAKARPPLTPVIAPDSPTSDRPFVGFLDDTKLDELGLGSWGCGPTYDHAEGFSILSGYPSWPAELTPKEDNRNALEDQIKYALQPTHAVVCVQLIAAEPRFASGSHDRFIGGTYTGECRVYEIATAKYLGGAAIDVEMRIASGSSAKVAMDVTMANEVRSKLESALEPFGKVQAPFFLCHW